MKPKTPIVPTKIDPQLMDVVLDELTSVLETKLSWLNHAYGKVETQIEGKGRDKIISPAIYVGTKNNRGYLKMFPDSHIGNFAFIEVTNQQMKHEPKQFTIHNVDFGIVFWFNFESVYTSDHNQRTVENVKSEVFDVMDQHSFQSFKYKFSEFIEGADNIYKGFTHKEIESQFLMRPYGGFRINGLIRYQTQCI